MRRRRHLRFLHIASLGLSLGCLGAAEPWVDSGVAWLIKAQHPDGGWGAGSHASQQVRDPHAVQTDPATTAFVSLALMRLGNTPTTGPQSQALVRAIGNLVATVRAAPADGPRITDLQGTQIQTKLGPLIDTAMTAQALARALPLYAAEDPQRAEVDVALEKCLAKLKSGQTQEGHWGGGGWAPVLQASTACSAMELAQAAGKTVDGDGLRRARDWQKGNVRGAVNGAAAVDGATTVTALTSAPAAAPAMSAGVELYSFAGGQRANASEARAAQDAIDEAKKDGRLRQDAELSVETLTTATGDADRAKELAASVVQNEAQKSRVVNDDRLLSGFGNNGGEEYLSYLMTSESLIIDGGKEFQQWMTKMNERLPKAQNPDGSWSGHHCITSPVFCTAAVVQITSVESEAPFLRRIAAIAAADRPASP